MKDVLEFVVKMKDMVSGGMSKMASTTRSALNQMDNNLARTAQRMRRPAQSIDMLNNKLNDLKKTRDLSISTSQIRSANREIDKIQNKLTKLENVGTRSKPSGGSGGGIMGLLSSGKGLAAAAGITAAVALGGSALGMGLEGTAKKTSFEVMGGEKAGGKLYSDLNKFAKDSIFGNEVYQDAQTMLGFGASVKEVMPDLKMLGDISMGNKDKLGSLTLAFSQSRAAGKLMGQDVLQMVNAGFNPLLIMSEKTGRSMSDLRKAMEEGKIPFSMVRQAFESATAPGGRFFDMTNRIAQTPFGKWEALKGNIQGIGLQLGTALLPIASKVMDNLSGLANYLPGVITSLQPAFDMAGGLISPLLGMIPTIMSALAPIMEMVKAIPMKQLITDIVGFAQSILVALVPIFNNLKPLIVTVLSVVGDLVHKVFELAKPLISLLAPILGSTAKLLSGVLTPALKVVGWALGGIIDLITWVATKLDWLLTPVTKFLSFVTGGISDMLDKVTAVVESKKNAIAERIKQGVSNNEIVAFFKKAGEIHGNNYVNALMGKYGAVARFMDNMYHTKAFTNKFKEIRNSLTGITATSGASGKAADDLAFTPGKGGFDSVSGSSTSGNSGTSSNGKGGNIIVHKLFENIIIQAQNLDEGLGELDSKVEEAMRRVIYSWKNAV